MNQAEIDPATSTQESRRIVELKKGVREPCRDNEILKAASVFFPRGLKGCGVGDVGGHPRSAGRPPAPKPDCSPTPSSWAVFMGRHDCRRAARAQVPAAVLMETHRRRCINSVGRCSE